MRRSADLADKRLWASPAVWWDQTGPPPRVCRLYALQQAEQLQQLKASLPRVAVPHIQAVPPLPQQQVDSDGGTKLTSPPGASKKQHTAQKKAARSTVWLSSCQHCQQEEFTLLIKLLCQTAGLVLGMDFLELSDTLLAFAQYGHVLQVCVLCRC